MEKATVDTVMALARSSEDAHLAACFDTSDDAAITAHMHAFDALRAEVERLAAQAASAPAVRMLTEDEAESVWGRTGLNRVHYAADVIREFCAVNAGKRIPASGEIGSV